MVAAYLYHYYNNYCNYYYYYYYYYPVLSSSSSSSYHLIIIIIYPKSRTWFVYFQVLICTFRSTYFWVMTYVSFFRQEAREISKSIFKIRCRNHNMSQPSPKAFSARSILDSTVSCGVTEMSVKQIKITVKVIYLFFNLVFFNFKYVFCP